MKSMQNTKKITYFISLGLLIVLLSPSIILAHPPKGLSAVYDVAAQKLTVRIDHGSLFPSKHYIDKVEVKKNAQVVITQTYKNQPEKNPFEYTYDIPAAEGDVLEIIAGCNFYGSKTISITVAKQAK
jgi:hypothetical protein